MAFKDVDKVLDYRAKQVMISWSLKGFKRAFPRLYRTICYAMDDAYSEGKKSAREEMKPNIVRVNTRGYG